MARRYQNGESPGDLAASYGIHRNSLFKILRRHGTPLRKESPAPAGLIEDYRAGMPMTSLARQHGVSPNLIKRWLTQEGVEIRGRGETNRRRAEAMTPEERAAKGRELRAGLRVSPAPQS